VFLIAADAEKVKAFRKRTTGGRRKWDMASTHITSGILSLAFQYLHDF